MRSALSLKIRQKMTKPVSVVKPIALITVVWFSLMGLQSWVIYSRTRPVQAAAYAVKWSAR